MYDASDPRAKLSAAAPASGEAVADPQYFELVTGEPSLVSPMGSPTWVVRGQNFVLALSDLREGDYLDRPEDQHEYFVLVGDPNGSLQLSSHDQRVGVDGRSVAILPEGESRVLAVAPTRVVRIFDVRTTELTDLAKNSSAYVLPNPRVAPLGVMPATSRTGSIRSWLVDDIAPEPGRFGRIFRSQTLMINYMYDTVGPRNPAKMSPHHHEDFEQGSLALDGTFDHHIRTPWGTDMGQWKADDHRAVGSPSLAIIPPPTIHTTRATGEDNNLLIDVFSPPREDFSNQPGWVLNNSDYLSGDDFTKGTP